MVLSERKQNGSPHLSGREVQLELPGPRVLQERQEQKALKGQPVQLVRLEPQVQPALLVSKGQLAPRVLLGPQEPRGQLVQLELPGNKAR